jgi:hypothetical protein
MPRSKMMEAKPPLLHMFSWLGVQLTKNWENDIFVLTAG